MQEYNAKFYALMVKVDKPTSEKNQDGDKKSKIRPLLEQISSKSVQMKGTDWTLGQF